MYAKWILACGLLLACSSDYERPESTEALQQSAGAKFCRAAADVKGPRGTPAAPIVGACDDGNACTVDSCDPAIGCVHALRAVESCRPAVSVSYPPRGATLRGAASDPTVTVTGSVSSAAGPITSLSINDESVPVGPNGSFAKRLAVSVGPNTFVIETADAFGGRRRKVQSFLWSTAYVAPGAPASGEANSEISVWLSQGAIDDGVRDEPIDDLAHALDAAAATIDFGSLSGLKSTATDPITGLSYELSLRSFDMGDVRTSLAALDRGLEVRLLLSAVDLGFAVECEQPINPVCLLLGGATLGRLSYEKVELKGAFAVTVQDRRIHITPASSSVALEGAELDLDNALVNSLAGLFEQQLSHLLEQGLDRALPHYLDDAVGQIESALNRLPGSYTVDVPRLDRPGESIPLAFAFDYSEASATGGMTGGMTFALESTARSSVLPKYVNAGVPLRVGCLDNSAPAALPKTNPIEVLVPDDLVNQVLYALWQGGLLELEHQPVPTLASDTLSNVSVDVSAMLAPTVSDCAPDRRWRATLGDMVMNVSFSHADAAFTAKAWATLGLGLEGAAEGEFIGLRIAGLDSMALDVAMGGDGATALEGALRIVLERYLRDRFVPMLAATPLSRVPLPRFSTGAAILRPIGATISHDNGHTLLTSEIGAGGIEPE